MNHPTAVPYVFICSGQRARRSAVDTDRQDDGLVSNKSLSLAEVLPANGGMEIIARVSDVSPTPDSLETYADSLLHTVIQHMQDFVILVDRDQRVIAINDAAINNLSLPRQIRGNKLSIDMFSRVVSDGITGKPIDENNWLIGRVLIGEVVQSEPRVIEFADGSRKDFLVQCSPILDGNGQVVMGLVVGWDVTSIIELQMEAEAALADARMERENLRRLVDNMVSGVMFLDSKLRIVEVNRTYARMFAPGVDLRMGAYIGDVLPQAEESGIMSLLRRALNTERPVRALNFRYEGLRKSTTYWNCSVVPVQLRGNSGTEMGVAMLLLDVTAEIRARAQLEELAAEANERARLNSARSKRLETIIHSTPVPVIVVSRDRAVTNYNSAAQKLCHDLGLGEWIERFGSFHEVTGLELLTESGEMVSPRRDPLSRSLRGENCSGQMLQVRAAQGPFKWLEVNSAPFELLEGERGAVLAIHDVTDERRAQEQLAQAYIREHAIAEKLQTSFSPGGWQSISGFDIGHAYKTGSDEALVGGDFFDMFRLGKHKHGLVVADVAGKGLNAAVYTAMTKYMLRAYALEENAPELVLARLNEALYACTPPEVFVTLIYGILNGSSRTMIYANAGHEQPMFCSRRMAVNLDVTGRALGLMNGSSYTTREVEFGQDDLVVLYTDGIPDAGTGRDRLGIEAMLGIVEKNADSCAQGIADILLGTAIQFCSRGLSDDAAVMVVKAVDQEDTGR